MWNQTEWLQAADEVAHQLLEYCGYERGPVDASQLCHSLGFDVIYDRNQSARGRMKQFGPRRSLFIKPDKRPERGHWAICHELGECFAHQVFHHVGANPQEAGRGMREQVANLMASRLLLPGKTFFPAMDELAEDLPALKQIFSTASHELIALRILDRARPRCLTIVDQSRITKRLANLFSCSRNMLPPERECWQKAHEECLEAADSDEQLHARCWPIHEPHWKREILLSRPAEEAAIC